MGAVYYRRGSLKLFKPEHPDRFVEEKFLARLIPHRLIYNMDRHVFKQVQGVHKMSPDLRVITTMGAYHHRVSQEAKTFGSAGLTQMQVVLRPAVSHHRSY